MSTYACPGRLGLVDARAAPAYIQDHAFRPTRLAPKARHGSPRGAALPRSPSAGAIFWRNGRGPPRLCHYRGRTLDPRTLRRRHCDHPRGTVIDARRLRHVNFGHPSQLRVAPSEFQSNCIRVDDGCESSRPKTPKFNSAPIRFDDELRTMFARGHPHTHCVATGPLRMVATESAHAEPTATTVRPSARDLIGFRRSADGSSIPTVGHRAMRSERARQGEGADHTNARGQVLETMKTTHEEYAGSGFEAEIGALAGSTTNRFDRLAAQCRDAGCTGGR